MSLKRIYHIADVHIRNVKRHTEYRQIFERMFEEIRKKGTEDSLIYLAGDIAHAKLEMSPELVREINWLFTECAKCCPTILIAGNHDCNMNNSDRLDVLTPIVEALNLPNFYYLKDTQVWKWEDISFAVFSIFDQKENWPKADEIEGRLKIALFHGPVDRSMTDIGYVVNSRHFTTDQFDGYDIALLGDIHKRQEMTSPKGCKIVYAGSLVQQNFGEALGEHGFLIWDLDTLTYESVDIPNDWGYYTLDIDSGKVPSVDDMPKHARLRVRLSNTDNAETKKVITKIRMMYGIEEFTIIKTDSLSKKKTKDRDSQISFEDVADVNYQNTLITEYVERMIPGITSDELAKLQTINTEINNRIVHDDIHRNIRWKPIRFEFSNMFSYGEKNKIDFNKVNGLMGLFAPNASGKSSLFDAISFCLYDKCSRAFKAQNIMNNRKATFECHLTFEVDGEEYHIVRSARVVNKGRNVKVDVQFWKMESGQALSLNGTERRDTNTMIEQYVGTYEDFILTALSVQGNNALFIDKSQSERKDILAQFMGLNIFDKLYESASSEIKEVSTLIKNFKKTDFTTELADKVKALTEEKRNQKQIQKQLNELTEKRDEVIAKIVELSKALIPIDGGKINIVQLQNEKMAIEDTLKKLERSKEKLVSDIMELEKSISKLFLAMESDSEFEGSPIVKVKKQLDTLQNDKTQIEKKIDKLESQLDANRDKLSHLEKHEYDPNCKFCVNNVFVKDAIATKEIVETQSAQLKVLQSELDEINTNLNRFKDVDAQWERFLSNEKEKETKENAKSRLESEYGKVTANIQLYQSKSESVVKDIERYHQNEGNIRANELTESKIAKTETLKKEYDTELKRFNKQLNDSNTQIGSLETFIDATKRKIQEVKDLEEKNQLYTYYLDAVNRDGVPYELITKAMPVIETEINNILAQVVDFGVIMEIDGKNINGKIVYEDQEWPLEMCSGMEKFVSGLAIRVALINICNLPRPNFLVIDEGFGTLDSDNLSSLFMMMQYLKTQFDFIWVISHLEQMRDIVDGLIEIKKVDGFSKIDF
jgi:DNA repair exonuclease SbcCD ATPase subunit